ncbi:MAG: hypothetical protein GXO87_10335 [Chlorobi bacterium]|nr:hypothetical protein [Chlorobiota bacterium]
MSYKKIFTLSMLAFLFMAFSASIAQDKPMKDMDSHKMEMKAKTVDVKAADKNGDGEVYACGMCGVVQDEAGKCSGCGGELHKMSVKDAEAKMSMKGEGMHERMEMHKEGAMSAASIDKNKDGKVYGCAMCAEFSDKDGECSKCGMKYKEMSVKDAEKKMENMKHKMQK